MLNLLYNSSAIKYIQQNENKWSLYPTIASTGDVVELVMFGKATVEVTTNAISNGKPYVDTHTFIDFLLSDEGQKLIENTVFLSLRNSK